jgi:hypothetical protein
LRISLAADGEAFMEGMAVRVFDGTVDPRSLATAPPLARFLIPAHLRGYCFAISVQDGSLQMQGDKKSAGDCPTGM